MGYDTIKSGLHRYFETYQWQNTTLPDFVGCLQWAFENSGDTAMGEDFNFTEWCDTWLTTSGVNVLEPVVEYNDDQSVKSFAIKQTCDLRGKNRLRKQKLDVAFYDESLTAHVIRDVVISEKEQLNPLDVAFDFPVKAVIVNHGDHAYAKVRFDQKTLDCFEDELCKIDEYLTRSVVWRQLWLLVMDGRMSSLQYFDFVIKQLPQETVEQSIVATLTNLTVLAKYYIPEDSVRTCQEKMFTTLLDLLARDIPDSIKSPVVDNIFGFISHEDHVALALKWVDCGFVHPAAAADQSLFSLSKSHKHQIVTRLHKSLVLSQEAKNALLEQVIGDDKSDLARNTRLTCQAATPTEDAKAEVWRELVDPQSKLSLYERRAQMAGFYSWAQVDVCQPYFDKFYEALPDLSAHHTYKYIETFFYSMLPRMRIEDRHIVKLMTIKSQVPDTNSMYMKVL